MKSWLSASVLAVVLCSGDGAALAQSQAPGYEETKTILWSLEQSIYAGRANGTMASYAANQSPYYRVWPVGWSAPAKPLSGLTGLKGGNEQVQMTFVNMAYNGQTAVMMYKTHRTRTSDGSPADDYFEVTHVWSKEDDKWRLLAARPQPVQPPGK